MSQSAMNQSAVKDVIEVFKTALELREENAALRAEIKVLREMLQLKQESK